MKIKKLFIGISIGTIVALYLFAVISTASAALTLSETDISSDGNLTISADGLVIPALGTSSASNCLAIDASGNVSTRACGTSASQWTTSGSKIYYNSGNVGIGTSNPTSKLSVNGTINGAMQDFGGEVHNVKAYGAVGDGLTDDYTAVMAAIQAAYDAGGGTVFFPAGTYLITRQIIMPYEAYPTFWNANAVRTKNIRLTGVGGGPNWYQTWADGASILDMTFGISGSGDSAKIETWGMGALKIDNLTFKDTGTDSNPFIHSTNTTLAIRDNNFEGSHATTWINPGFAGPYSTQDAIVLGDITGNMGIATGMFQGYGTVIDSNHFKRLNRGIYGKSAANAVVVSNNSWQANTGTVAMEFHGSVSYPNDYGNHITGNLIEMDVYQYGIKLYNSPGNYIAGNNFSDDTSQVVYEIYMENNSSGNTIIPEGYSSNPKILGGDSTSLLGTTILGWGMGNSIGGTGLPASGLDIKTIANGAGLRVVGSGGAISIGQGGVLSYLYANSTTIPFTIGTLGNASMNFVTANNSRLYISPAGNVGIGSSWADGTLPTHALDITGALATSGDIIDGNLKSQTCVGTDSSGKLIAGTCTGSGGSQTPWTGTINAAGYTLNGNSTASGNLTLDSTSDATKGYVLLNPSGGSVGIGTSTPTNPFTVISTSFPQARLGYDANNYLTTSVGGLASSFVYTAASASKFMSFGFNNTSNLGIWLTTPTAVNMNPAGSAPTASLEVGLASTFKTIETDGPNGGVVFWGGGLTNGIYAKSITSTTGFTFGTDSGSSATGSYLNLMTHGTNAIIIDGSQHVGIGTAAQTVVPATLKLGGTLPTLRVGDDGLTGCIEMGNSDGSAGINYITVLNGTISATTVKPAMCQ